MKGFTKGIANRAAKIAVGGLMLAGAAVAMTSPADARVVFGVGIGGPGYYGPGYAPVYDPYCDPRSRWFNPRYCDGYDGYYGPGYYGPGYYGYGPFIGFGGFYGGHGGHGGYGGHGGGGYGGHGGGGFGGHGGAGSGGHSGGHH